MFYSYGNVNEDAAVITVPSSSSGLEVQMFFLTYGIIEISSVQMLRANTRTNTQLRTSPGPWGALPKGISHCHSHKLLKTKLRFASLGLKKITHHPRIENK